jgi:type 1 glutamine amidotransferase
MRNLILTGGFSHSFPDAAPALADVLADAGFASTITEHIEAGIASLAEGAFDLVTVYALRWRMLTGEKYQPYRAQWAFSLSEAGRQTLTRFVETGGGLLALHTAAICFDDWPEWRQLIGGAWIWGRSSHPPLGPVPVTPGPGTHAITAEVPPFELRDEVYGNLDMEAGVEPLLMGDAGAGSWPLLWARPVGKGRVVTDLLGHDRAAIEQPVHRRILTRSAQWCTRAL